jgi:hypothetical protein
LRENTFICWVSDGDGTWWILKACKKFTRREKNLEQKFLNFFEVFFEKIKISKY